MESGFPVSILSISSSAFLKAIPSTMVIPYDPSLCTLSLVFSTLRLAP